MRLRQAQKVLKRLLDWRHKSKTIVAAFRVHRRFLHRSARRAGLKSSVRVTIRTDTAFDEEGVPVGVAYGGRGIVVDLDGFPQVLCNTAIGMLVVGIPAQYLELADQC